MKVGRCPGCRVIQSSQRGLRLSFFFSRTGLRSQEPAEGWAWGHSPLMHKQPGNSWPWKWEEGGPEGEGQGRGGGFS